MAALASAILTFAQPHAYKGQAVVEVQTLNQTFLNLQEVRPTLPSTFEGGLYMQTQADLLDDDALLAEAARRLHLEERREFQPASTILRKLRRSVRIVPVRNTRILQIVCEAGNPELAAAMANTLAQVFIEQGIETRQQAAEQLYDSLRLQLKNGDQRLPPEPDWAAKLPPEAAGGPTVDGRRQFYESMLERANRAQLASVVRQPHIQLVAPAEPATQPFKPNLPINLALGTLAGFLAAVGFVMLREENVSVVRAPGEAASYLTRPELGAVPNYAIGTPAAQRADAFRSVLASLFSNERRPRIVVVTSSHILEGKSTFIANLAMALGETGSRVLLMDADLRRPRLHTMFAQENSWGLSDFLNESKPVDEYRLDELAKQTADSGLFLMPSGRRVERPFALSAPDRMQRLFDRLHAEFDCVLVNAPPSLESVDASTLARYAEATVLVVRANYTELNSARAAIQRLEGNGKRITGIVLNRWDPCFGDTYGYPFRRVLKFFRREQTPGL